MSSVSLLDEATTVSAIGFECVSEEKRIPCYKMVANGHHKLDTKSPYSCL